MTSLNQENGEKESTPSFEVLIQTEDYAEFRIDKSIIGISHSNDGVTIGYRPENQPHSAEQSITIPENQFIKIIAVVVKEMGESFVEGISETFVKEIGEGMKEFAKEFPLTVLGAAIGMMMHASTKNTKDE